jgi:basic amino acid/polyamine antiporter, APA family
LSTHAAAVAAPQPVLAKRDAIGLIVGLVIGAGIFTLPALVAKSTTDPYVVYGLWLAGGLLSIIGALCYAELATTYPNAGGDYFFLQRAWGPNVSFLFAWARVAVVTTGSIAFLAFTFGDYATKILSLGPWSSSIYAALSVLALTAINILGIREGSSTQNILTVLEVLGVVAIIVAGLALVAPVTGSAPAVNPNDWKPTIGLALVFVLFAYGGWNEAAYISAELKDKRAIVGALVWSLVIVTVLYLLINIAYVRGLGLWGVAGSKTVAAELLDRTLGSAGAIMISVIVAISALTSINATIIVGARSNFALGRDFPIFSWLGRWEAASGTPRNGLIVQCVVSLILIGLGTATRQGLQTMVDYTAPVFWFFFLMVGIGLFVLRAKDPDIERPFKVPLYPITPFIFCAMCAYLLYSALDYAGTGMIAGVGVLVFGLAPLFASKKQSGLAWLFALIGLAIIAMAFPSVRALLLGGK